MAMDGHTDKTKTVLFIIPCINVKYNWEGVINIIPAITMLHSLQLCFRKLFFRDSKTLGTKGKQTERAVSVKKLYDKETK